MLFKHISELHKLWQKTDILVLKRVVNIINVPSKMVNLQALVHTGGQRTSQEELKYNTVNFSLRDLTRGANSGPHGPVISSSNAR
jgi:hypothetical protein